MHAWYDRLCSLELNPNATWNVKISWSKTLLKTNEERERERERLLQYICFIDVIYKKWKSFYHSLFCIVIIRKIDLVTYSSVNSASTRFIFNWKVINRNLFFFLSYIIASRRFDKKDRARAAGSRSVPTGSVRSSKFLLPVVHLSLRARSHPPSDSVWSYSPAALVSSQRVAWITNLIE